eukprot:gene49873-biopygen14472
MQGTPSSAPSTSFWLETGCSNPPLVSRGIVGRWATADQSAQVQCCNASGSCTRRDRAGNCFSGDDDVTRATHYEAVAMCSQAGMRLCTMQELQIIDAAGCCGTGCNYDAILVWTSTTPTVAPYAAGDPSNAPTSLTTAPTAAYTTIGSGWCRAAGCIVSGTDCFVAGMRKDYSSAAECMAMCSSMPDCTGYAIASPFYSRSPNRCYVHGAFQTHSGWYDFAMHVSERNYTSLQASCPGLLGWCLILPPLLSTISIVLRWPMPTTWMQSLLAAVHCASGMFLARRRLQWCLFVCIRYSCRYFAQRSKCSTHLLPHCHLSISINVCVGGHVVCTHSIFIRPRISGFDAIRLRFPNGANYDSDHSPITAAEDVNGRTLRGPHASPHVDAADADVPARVPPLRRTVRGAVGR